MSFENELRERLHDSASRIDVDDDLFARAEQLHQRHVRKVQLGGALGVAAVLALGVVAGPWLADRFDPSPAPIIGEEETPSVAPTDGATSGRDATAGTPPLLDTWSVLDELGVPTEGIVNREAYRAETAGEEQVFILRYDQVAERPYAVSLANPDGITDLVTAEDDEAIDLHGSIELEGAWYAIVSVTSPDGARAFLLDPTGERRSRSVEVAGADVRFHDLSPMLLGDAPDVMSIALMPTYARGDGPLETQPAATSETSPELRPLDAMCRGCELLAIAGWDRHVALVDRAGDGTQTLRLVDALTGEALAEHPYEAPAVRVVGGPEGFLVSGGPVKGWLYLGLDGRLAPAPDGGFLTFAKEPLHDDAPQVEAPAPTPGWTMVPDSPIGVGWYLTTWTGSELYVLGTSFDAAGASGDIEVHAYRPSDGSWRTVSAPPIPQPYGSQLVWTGTEVVLLGGDPIDDETGDAGGSPTVEGWAYEPGANSWRQLPEAPLAPRVEFTATWTGDELIVWGGFSQSWNSETGVTDVTTYADGAAWDPATNTWRELAPSPLAARGFHGAVWNGRRLVVFGGGSTEQYESEMFIERGFDDAAVYDPASDTWATITSPGPIGPLVAYAWSGDRILYWTGHLSDDRGGSWLEPGAVWDPIDGSSDPLPAPPFDVRRDGGVDSTWVDGLGWLVWGGGCGEGCNQSFREGAILRAPDLGTWTRLVPPEGEVGFGATGVWLGDRLMTLGGSRESYSPEITTNTDPLIWTPQAGAQG